MEPNQIIHRLKSSGLSEIEIARRLTSSGTKVSQSTINRIANGQLNTSYRIGRALELLHQQIAA